jgi:hypothetical protein
MTFEPLTKKMECDGWKGSTSGIVYRKKDVLSALEGLKREMNAYAMPFTGKTYDLMFLQVSLVDKWFPFAKDEDGGSVRE